MGNITVTPLTIPGLASPGQALPGSGVEGIQRRAQVFSAGPRPCASFSRPDEFRQAWRALV